MLDVLIVLIFVAYSITSGFRAKKQASKNLEEYFLAGRSIKGWRAGVSMAATQFAADTPLLVTGLIASGGIFLIWRLWVYGIAFLMMGFVFAVLWRRAGVLTDAELTEARYSGGGLLALRTLKAVYFGTVINCAVLAFVLVAAVRIGEIFAPWHQWLPDAVYGPVAGLIGIIGIELTSGVTPLDPVVATTNNLLTILGLLAFTLLYSTTGGLRSVIATDVFQFGIALGGTLIFAVIIVLEAGGLGSLMDRLVELYGAARVRELTSFSVPTSEALAPFLVIISLQWFFQMNSDGTGYLAQRSMACQTDRQARIAAVVFSWLQVFLRSLIWIVIGVGLLAIYPFTAEDAASANFVAAREMTFVQGINDFLPTGARGLMLTGLLAALASTIDTHLNWGASYWSNDIYKRLISESWMKRTPRSSELIFVARLSNVLILVIALIVMSQLGSIQQGWKISLLFGAGIGAVLVLRWLWERINLHAEFAAIAVSLVAGVALLWIFPDEADGWTRLGLMALISTVTTVFVALLTPPTDEAKLIAFYERVRPMGFWQSTARLAGDEPAEVRRRLYANLTKVGWASLSLFLALAGAGRLLIHVPGDSYATPLVFLALSIAVVPLWWSALRAKPV